MPYIKKRRRKSIDKFLDGLIVILINSTDNGKQNNGEVVYALFKLLKQIYGAGNFEIKSNALKVLDATSKEYYRKVIQPYEDEMERKRGSI